VSVTKILMTNLHMGPVKQNIYIYLKMADEKS